MDRADRISLQLYHQTLTEIARNIWELKIRLEQDYDLLPEEDQQNEPGETLHRESCYLEDIHAHLEQALEYITRIT